MQELTFYSPSSLNAFKTELLSFDNNVLFCVVRIHSNEVSVQLLYNYLFLYQKLRTRA